MAATTTLLGLVTPTQGTLSGTWGDTVNYGITDYLDIAIAGTLSFAGDGAITLANTTGSASGNGIVSTTAQYAMVRVTGTLTTTKIITAPSYSKTYILINDATGGSVTIKAAGQTGVTVAVGDKALVAYNGTDYVRVGASVGGSNTQVQFNSSGNLAGSASLTFDSSTGALASTIYTGRLKAYEETVTTVGTVSAATYNIDLSLSNIFDITLGNNVTFTFTNPPSSGVSKLATVILRQDATGSRLATFTNAKYTDGNLPQLSTGANQIDVLTFFTVNGGSFWFGTFAMANVS